MEILMFFLFAVIFAMLFNYGMPRFTSKLAQYPSVAPHITSYAGQTVVTAVFIFVVLLVVGYVFSLAGANAKVGAVEV